MSGYTPNIMRASRKINDEMTEWVVKRFIEFINKKNVDIKNTEITFMGYSFKENCSDTRNTKVKDLIYLVKNKVNHISLWDPVVELNELKELEDHGIKIYTKKPKNIEFAFLCVNHDEIKSFLEDFDGLIFDYKNIDLN
jgi:UDP-N-acetyl-D-galactosamine dehydrogenase